MEIIKLDSSQKKRASDILAAAFFEYPMFTFYFPDPKRRARCLPLYLGDVLKCALRYGEAYVTPDVSGVIFFLPPGHTKISQWEYIQNGFLRAPFLLGRRYYKRSMECEAFVGDTHEQIMNGRPHYYLWGLVADPGRQRKGVGSALMEPLIAKSDAERMPIYLETHEENNVAYYQRKGFNLVRTDSIPKYGLKIWCMLREPA
jgi:GNAT superfamily N-acetyltransferase